MRKAHLTFSLISMNCLMTMLWGCNSNSQPGSSVQAQSVTGGSLVQVYSETIVAVSSPSSGTAGKCVDCHTSTGSESVLPFADSNMTIAFNSGITSLGLINVANPSASVLLEYLTNSHCGGAECNENIGSAVYQNFLAAAQTYAQAANAPGANSGVSSSPIPTPSPTVPVSQAGGSNTASVTFPSNPPLLGNTSLLLHVPLAAINTNLGSSYIQLSINYTVAGTNSLGAQEYLYDISSPVLVNTTSGFSVRLAGFYIAHNGMVDLTNNVFSNANQYYATAMPNSTQSLNPNGVENSINLEASPGDTLSIVVIILQTGAM